MNPMVRCMSLTLYHAITCSFSGVSAEVERHIVDLWIKSKSAKYLACSIPLSRIENMGFQVDPIGRALRAKLSSSTESHLLYFYKKAKSSPQHVRTGRSNSTPPCDPLFEKAMSLLKGRPEERVKHVNDEIARLQDVTVTNQRQHTTTL